MTCWSNIYFEKENNFFYRYALLSNALLVFKKNFKNFCNAKKRNLTQNVKLSTNLICCFEIKKNDFRKQKSTNDEYIVDLNGNTYTENEKIKIRSGTLKPHRKIIKIKNYILENIYGKNTKIAIYENHIKYITDDEIIVELKTEDAIEDNPFINNEFLFSIDKEDFLNIINELHKDSFISFIKKPNKVFKERTIAIKTVTCFYSKKNINQKKNYKMDSINYQKKEITFILELSFLLNFIRSKFINELDMLTFSRNGKNIIINDRLIIKEEQRFLFF